MPATGSSVHAAVLTAARAGSSEALGRALDRCRHYLLDIARHSIQPGLRAKGGASDLVQETFLEAHRLFPGFEGDSSAQLRAWLRSLLLHRAAKLGRRLGRSADAARMLWARAVERLKSELRGDGPPH